MLTRHSQCLSAAALVAASSFTTHYSALDNGAEERTTEVLPAPCENPVAERIGAWACPAGGLTPGGIP